MVPLLEKEFQRLKNCNSIMGQTPVVEKGYQRKRKGSNGKETSGGRRVLVVEKG